MAKYLKFSEGGPALPIAGVNPVAGIRQRPFYNAFRVDAPGVADFEVVGFKPQSTPNVAISGNPSRGTNGTAFISTQYTTTKSFTLSGLYLGLQISLDNAAVQVPTKGTVQLTGYASTTGAVVASTTLEYDPKEAAVQALQFKSLPKEFAGLTRVTLVPEVDQSNVVGTITGVGLVMDDVMGSTTP